MYTPKTFKVEDGQQIEEFLAANPFAILISAIDGKIEATHLPINRFGNGKWYGHIAKANQQIEIKDFEEVCLIFSGPHTYVSPNYYKTDFNVPTWNYSAVHYYGKIMFIDDEALSWKLIQELVELHEGENGWRVPKDEKYKNLTNHIRFFEFIPSKLEAAFKFNQNKTREDIQSVIEAMKNSNKLEVAEFMTRVTNR